MGLVAAVIVTSEQLDISPKNSESIVPVIDLIPNSGYYTVLVSLDTQEASCKSKQLLNYSAYKNDNLLACELLCSSLCH